MDMSRTLASTIPAFILFCFAHAGSSQTWSPLGEGVSSAVYSMKVFQDDLFVGGTFIEVDGISTYYLARWNGSAWGSIGNLIAFMGGDGLYATDTALFVGDAGRVRWWNGSTWNMLPGVFNSSIYSISHLNDTLYVGGFFSSLSGEAFPHIARWNGTEYENLTSGCNAQVTDLTSFGGQLFVGGNFNMAGDSVVNHTALWNGSAWNRMATGVNDDVFTHCIFQDTLYIAGRFTQAGGAPASRVAKWNGTSWVAVGGTLNDYVTTMEVYRDQLYIGGAFTSPGHIARLSGNSWVAVGGGCNNTVRTMEVYNDTLFVGGSFTQAGGQPAARIARWHVPDLSVSVEQEDRASEFLFLPLPGGAGYAIQRVDGKDIGQVALYDALGKVILERSYNGPSAILSTEGLPRGILYARCQYEGRPVVRRLLIMAH
jgi:trimeric autotransporter adhesin